MTSSVSGVTSARRKRPHRGRFRRVGDSAKMESLSAYASDEEGKDGKEASPGSSGASAPHPKSGRKEDDTNYDHVTMDMSEESNNNNSDYDSPPESRRRSSQSSSDRDCSNTDSSPKEKKPNRKESPQVSDGSDIKSRNSPECQYDNGNKRSRSKERYRDPSGSRSQADVSKDQLKTTKNDVQSNSDKKRGCDKETKREYSNRKEKDGFDKKEKQSSERRDRDRDGERRHDGDRRDRNDRKHHSGDDRRKRNRSRSHDRSGHRRRSTSGERDKYKKHDSKYSSSRESRSYRKSRSKSPPAAAEYKPSYKVSKKLQAMDKMGLQIKTPDGSMATAQQLMRQTLAEQVEKVKNATGVELPKYYNPAAMNPLKYANQIQKRKMLWGNKSEAGESSTPVADAKQSTAAGKWQGTKFAQDSDGKVASKFMRLMGVKDPNVVKASVASDGGDVVKKQEEMFEKMQAQYEVARATTHTMRGVGLGFSSHNKQF